ncbi:hypothetical protein F7D08_0986 [Bifidobacterium cebidarum]|uniref:DUF1287 domain-containing protein n=2 Tax=Bifidobacterium cebidarum TaxID=2650773 RepID=A0A6I1G9M8_9BIFI|nr:DUF1287 domain-containing protein [Bifidobacterium cebidarum]KAB7788245.1 hypothetical protein F7D08_0986 [Bifidobacterium cebidarum]
MAQHLAQRGLNSAEDKRRKVIIAIIIVIALMIAVGISAGRYLTQQFRTDSAPSAQPSTKPMTASYNPSPVDFNGNGVDDYGDIVAGARKDAEARPQYDDGYYQGGYPPDDRGACTDLVWRAFREAGYDLKAMVDADIAADPASYASVAPNPDPNIDFRRTGVLDVFFSKYGQTLTTDTADTSAWQAGDIVVFEHTRHIGVISDKRDGNGLPFVLHNMGQRQRENDYFAFKHHMTVTGHYRFDASKVPQQVLKAWRQ